MGQTRAAECRRDSAGAASYSPAMKHVVMLALAAIWIAGNFYLWSMKQNHLTLFWQSLGMAAIAYPSLYWYVTLK